jgi:hypothetical protein
MPITPNKLFKGQQQPGEVIVLCLRPLVPAASRSAEIREKPDEEHRGIRDVRPYRQWQRAGKWCRLTAGAVDRIGIGRVDPRQNQPTLFTYFWDATLA